MSSEKIINSMPKSYKYDFLGRRKIWFIISSIIIITGLIFFFIRGFNYGIDFLGGRLIEVKFDRDVSITELREAMSEAGYGTSILQSTKSDQYIIRTLPINEEQKEQILDYLDKEIGIDESIIQDRSVAAGFSDQITKYAMIAVAISLAGILIYIWIRFELRFAIIAIFELLHDLLIVLSFYAITYREINTTSIAVILTILGYSLSDGIVVFDRIREELRFNKKDRLIDIVNFSINKILTRSLSTTATTLFPMLVLLIVGNETLKDFAFGLTIGIIAGAYSSIFFGPPILVGWNNRFPRYKK